MRIMRNARADGASQQRTDAFTGTVLLDTVMPTTEGVALNTVSFSPGARTNWHHHDAGQILVVTAGAGYVYDREGNGGPIATGDVVFIEPGLEHWHGAGPDNFMVHLAISLQTTNWLEPVSDEQYAADVARA